MNTSTITVLDTIDRALELPNYPVPIREEALVGFCNEPLIGFNINASTDEGDYYDCRPTVEQVKSGFEMTMTVNGKFFEIKKNKVGTPCLYYRA